MSPHFLSGGGETGALIRSFDWARTPVGAAAGWPQSLRTVIAVLLASPEPLLVWWGPDLVQFYNDPYRPLLGASRHPAAIGQTGPACWRESWPVIEPAIATVRAGGCTSTRDRLRVIERHGRPEACYFTDTYSPVRDESGEVGGILVASSDTTGRVVAERRLGVLTQLASAAADAKSLDGACAAAARVLSEDRLDVPFALIYLADDPGAVVHLAARVGIAADHPAAPPRVNLTAAASPWPLAEAGSAEATVNLTALGAPGKSLPRDPWPDPPAEALVLPLAPTGQARPDGYLVAGLSPRLPVDEAYRRFLRLVAGHIASALHGVRAAEDARRRAGEVARLDQAKTAFLANVSHQFRTPLTLMLGPLADLLGGGDGALDPGAREQLETVHRNSLRLGRLVDTLIDFARADAGRLNARLEPVDLAAFTADLAGAFRSAIEGAGLALHVDAPPLPAPVLVDRAMWEQVILNLVSNAFKFTFKGAISVRVAPIESGVEVVVADTGEGIPPQELPHLFERFHRIECARSRSQGGAGTSLAHVQELVRVHGGTIHATSAVDRGTTFTIRLPARAMPPDVRPHAPAVAAVAHPAVTGAYVREALRWLPSPQEKGARQQRPEREAVNAVRPRGHIIVADDNADMRDYIARLLRREWTVEAVSNGAAALDAAAGREPSLVIADVLMPVLDGFGLLRALRTHETLRSVPVLLLSARAGEDSRVEALGAMADGHLTKPFSARELLAQVEALHLKSRIRALERMHMRRFADVFNLAPVGIAVLRGDEHRFELANPPYLQLVGRQAIVGLPVREALPELESQGFTRILDHVRQSGRPYVGRSTAISVQRGTDGGTEELSLDIVCQPIADEQGRPDALVVVVHDVTELARARREAETANRLKDEFLATLSHELRTPLNAVLGYTQMLRAGAVRPERQRAALDTIERNARLQTKLIDDVLDVSRVITGKLRLEVRAVDLVAVLQDALDTVEPAAEAKGVQLQTIVEPTGVSVAGDPQRLLQVVWNLLSNAVKFTPSGGRVQIRTRRAASYVELAVSDTGEGIPPEFLPRLFDRFSQADTNMARKHGGLGLGLAICRHLVEAHGGTIEASSRGKGLGATFKLRLPVVSESDAHASAADKPSADGAGSDLGQTDLNGLRVLVVDDDVDALAMARDALMHAGAEVRTEADGPSGLQALDASTFDVLVLDIGLPFMDGYELMRTIRQRPFDRQGRVPALALTAYARAQDRADAFQAGFDLHLVKPVQPGALAAAVGSLARRRALGNA